MSRQRSSAWLFAAAFVCFVVYASLHPFSGWSEPSPPGSLDWVLPRPRGFTRFDVFGNLLAYVPLGALFVTAWVRDGGRRVAALVIAVTAASLLSYTLEQVQHTLPMRVPSVIDWQLNTAGAAIGALLAVVLDAVGALVHGSAGANAGCSAAMAAALRCCFCGPRRAAVSAAAAVRAGAGARSASRDGG